MGITEVLNAWRDQRPTVGRHVPGFVPTQTTRGSVLRKALRLMSQRKPQRSMWIADPKMTQMRGTIRG